MRHGGSVIRSTLSTRQKLQSRLVKTSPWSSPYARFFSFAHFFFHFYFLFFFSFPWPLNLYCFLFNPCSERSISDSRGLPKALGDEAPLGFTNPSQRVSSIQLQSLFFSVSFFLFFLLLLLDFLSFFFFRMATHIDNLNYISHIENQAFKENLWTLLTCR